MSKTAFTALAYSENQLDEALARSALGDRLLELRHDSGQPVLVVQREHWADVLKLLRDTPGLEYGFFVDITAADLSRQDSFEPERRFQVVAVLYSIALRRRVRIKTYIPEEHCVCPSAVGVFAGANWCEREVWDMFGIRFEGHPDLRRLLTPEYMKHHPLRKEYPMQGKGERDNFPRYEEIQ